MATFAVQETLPRDCHNNPIRCGDVVYLPNGWTGTKPNPWSKVVVHGVSFINGRYWLDVDGYNIRQVPAHACSTVEVP